MRKMLKKAKMKTETYEYVEGFFVDIQDDGTCYNVWLFHESYGFKRYMYGLPIENTSREELFSIIKNSLVNDGYVDDYRTEHMDQ